jgi:restriction endonuclease
MAGQSKAWRNYEEVATYLLDQVASEFDLERVEGKQHVRGSLTTTDWEIDGKGVKVGDEGFIIIECRRYPKDKQNQGQVGELAFRIFDTGASGGIYVSPLGFQEGARKVAGATNIHEVKLRPDSTRTDYMLSFLNKVFLGSSDTVTMTESATVTVIRVDGTQGSASSAN